MAYNRGYQYGTSPRKLAPEYDRKPKKYPKKSTAKKTTTVKKQQEQTAKKVKENKKQQTKVVLYVLAVFAMLFVISYRNSTIAEDFSKIKALKTDLAAIEKENEQLKVNIESNLNLKKVEETAMASLGMQRLNNNQTVYIAMPKEDYIESVSEKVVTTEENNWIMDFINGILDKIK